MSDDAPLTPKERRRRLLEGSRRLRHEARSARSESPVTSETTDDRAPLRVLTLPEVAREWLEQDFDLVVTVRLYGGGTAGEAAAALRERGLVLVLPGDREVEMIQVRPS